MTKAHHPALSRSEVEPPLRHSEAPGGGCHDAHTGTWKNNAGCHLSMPTLRDTAAEVPSVMVPNYLPPRMRT